MNKAVSGNPSVTDREVAILHFLREMSEAVTASDIYKVVSVAIDDVVSRQAYYKLLDRLVAAGKLEQIDIQGVRHYKITPQLYSTNRLTLDDIYAMLPYYESAESVARALEAQQYFYKHRNGTIKKAAEALTKEPAVELFFRWISDLLLMIEKDIELYTNIEEEGTLKGSRSFTDQRFIRRLVGQVEILRDILYRQLSITYEAIYVPEWEGPRGLKDNPQNLSYDLNMLYEQLTTRVFGVGENQTVLGFWSVDKEVLKGARQDMIISGSDGSFHAGQLGLHTARGYVQDESFIVTFNNSVANIRSSERVEKQRGAKKFFYSAPLTRQTLNDPAYKGMVLAPFMFPMLTDSEYEHMTRAASDVVQMRVDAEVFNGTARDVSTGEQIMTPRVHIRDGTITPQERIFSHYYRMDPYGDIVREGITRSRSILQRILTSRSRPQVYAGAVKSTQIHLFSRLINWYIIQGSKKTLGEAIDPNWDSSQGHYIADIDVMTLLLATFPKTLDNNGFWVSCVVIRQFASLTDFFTKMLKDDEWFEFLQRMRKQALDMNEEYGSNLPYYALLSEDDLAEDDYLYMLEHADYASFYIGHTAGDPAPKIPRYEFLTSLRGNNSDKANDIVKHNVEQIVTALLVCNFTPDRDHNYLSNLSIVKLIPSVVYTAHEFAKHLGKKLEADFKSVVVARLAARREQPIIEKDVDIRPIGVREYLQRFLNARKSLPDSEQADDY